MPEGLYLDHAASTPMRPGVLEAMGPFQSGFHGNPSSMHRFGRKARKALEDARDSLASSLDCLPQEVCFTSGGTESDNLGILGAAHALPEGRRGVLTCATEHPAVLAPCRRLGARILSPLPDGRLDPAAFEAAIQPETGLASFMAANNETGVLHPIQALGRICRSKGILLHTDAVQAAGQIPLSFKTLPVDLLSLTAHKLGGPRGIGALLVRRGIRLAPVLSGGDHEGGRRPGTENVAGAVGLAEALRQALSGLGKEAERKRRLADRFLKALGSLGVALNGHPTERAPQTLSLRIPGMDATVLSVALDQEGLAVSGGSACHTGSADPSPVLTAMGLSPAEARATIRVSFGHSTTEAEADRAAGILLGVCDRIKSNIPLKAGSG